MKRVSRTYFKETLKCQNFICTTKKLILSHTHIHATTQERVHARMHTEHQKSQLERIKTANLLNYTASKKHLISQIKFHTLCHYKMCNGTTHYTTFCMVRASAVDTNVNLFSGQFCLSGQVYILKCSSHLNVTTDY